MSFLGSSRDLPAALYWCKAYELLKAKILARKRHRTEHNAAPSPSLPAPPQFVSQRSLTPILRILVIFISVPPNLVCYLDNAMIAYFKILAIPAAIHSYWTHNRLSVSVVELTAQKILDLPSRVTLVIFLKFTLLFAV